MDSRIASRIRELRGQARLSQRELATIVGVTAQYIGLIESGHRMPRGQLLAHIAEVLRWPPEEWTAVYLSTNPSPMNLVESARQLMNYRNWTVARWFLRQAWSVNQSQYDGRYIFSIAHALAVLASHQQRWRVALGWFRQLKGHLSHAHPATRATVFYDLGITWVMLGRRLHAFSALEQAWHYIRPVRRVLPLKGYIAMALGNILLESGDLAEALRWYRIAEPFLRQSPLASEVAYGVRLCSQWLGSAIDFKPSLNPDESLSTDLGFREKLTEAVYLRRIKRYRDAWDLLESLNPEGIPDRWVASWLTERCLLSIVSGRPTVEWRALRGQYQAIEQFSSVQDRLAMDIIALWCGDERSLRLPPYLGIDTYEERLSFLLRVLTSSSDEARNLKQTPRLPSQIKVLETDSLPQIKMY